ncbi:MAG: polyketide synthase, partial [Microcystaceae cyanobacterium]
TYALGILGQNKAELLKEVERAFQGVSQAFERGQDWQTPTGSYFTAKPLGQQGQVAFVYPGAYGAYVGLGQHLFRLFPKIYENPILRSVDNRVANVMKLLYPRSLSKLSTRQLEALEKRLFDDPLAMLESEMACAGVLTGILKDYFKIHPHCTFGYSLGEISMIVAQGVWTSFSQGSNAFNASPLFKTRLSGPKDAIREYWGLPLGQNHPGEEFWGTYVLMAPVSQVREHLKQENRVYLTQINTPKEVVIAGDVQACQRVIETLNCNAFRAPFNHVIHCEAMASEYAELVKLNTLPVDNVPNLVFYSAAQYEPLTLESDSISHHIAKALCQPFDFPRLINRVYEDGNRIFIETGAGSIC